jgi:hypothetical protein
MENGQETGLPWVYQIKALGRLSRNWSSWLDDLNIACETEEGSGDPVITFTGPVVDQAALRSLLNRIWDLNLTVISLARVEGYRGGQGR